MFMEVAHWWFFLQTHDLDVVSSLPADGMDAWMTGGNSMNSNENAGADATENNKKVSTGCPQRPWLLPGQAGGHGELLLAASSHPNAVILFGSILSPAKQESCTCVSSI